MKNSSAADPGKKSDRNRKAGIVISILCILFLLFDAIMKIIGERHSIEGSAQLGWPVEKVSALGILLLICTVIYAIPRTLILGAILLTAYLGAATAIMVRVGSPFYFPVIFGILVWAGPFLRVPKLRGLIPLTKE
jgi:sorbitol-specific phosphotransferase system component IIC